MENERVLVRPNDHLLSSPPRPALHFPVRLPLHPRALDLAAVCTAFAASPEWLAIRGRASEPQWAARVVQALETCEWGWEDLDLCALDAILFDSLPWTLERAPADAAAVARELEALMRFASRAYGAPHGEECAAYLRSATAVEGIERWLRPR